MTMSTNLRRGASAIALGLAVRLSFAELTAFAMAALVVSGILGGALVIGALVFNELLGWKEQK